MATEKAVLLVIDMQNDFCLPGAPLFVAGAPAIAESVKAAVDAARAKAIPVIWVVREHHVAGVDAEVTRAHLYKDGKGPVALLTAGMCAAFFSSHPIPSSPRLSLCFFFSAVAPLSRNHA